MGFTFKEFHINQSHTAMKVGTDGVLLGAWAEGGNKILDIGTGTGLIALMMAQRYPHSIIDAIDIDKGALKDATSNVANSPFSERINIIQSSLQSFRLQTDNEKQSLLYDAIVSNPPFFINSLKNKVQNRSFSRHTDTLSFNDLCRHASRLLKDNGTFSIIIPFENRGIVESEAIMSGLSISYVINIKTKESKNIKRCLIMFKKQLRSTYNVVKETLLNSKGERSEWYSHLTKDFYIK